MTFVEQILLVISVAIGMLSLFISAYNYKDINELQRENWRLKDRVHFLELFPINKKKKGGLTMFKIQVSENKYYMEFDGIRLVYENDELIGWYEPELDRVV